MCLIKKNYNREKHILKRNYVDEAIMKVEAKKRCTHALFFRYSRLDNRFDCIKNFRTTLRIEIRRELSRRAPSETHKNTDSDNHQYGTQRKSITKSHCFKFKM